MKSSTIIILCILLVGSLLIAQDSSEKITVHTCIGQPVFGSSTDGLSRIQTFPIRKNNPTLINKDSDEIDITFEEVSDIDFYPNPFTSSITFDLRSDQKVEVYDVNGRLVFSDSEIDQENLSRRNVSWTPDESMTAGIYLTRFTDKDTEIKKSILYVK